MYQSTKTYGHEVGLSCCFRQWRATHSHCRFLHGYALSVKLTFESETLDERNWVQDFGGLKDVKNWLKETFDHKTVIAEDDPEVKTFAILQSKGLIDCVIIPNVGCEAFAKYIFDHVSFDIPNLKSVEVREHGANSAIYTL